MLFLRLGWIYRLIQLPNYHPYRLLSLMMIKLSTEVNLTSESQNPLENRKPKAFWAGCPRHLCGFQCQSSCDNRVPLRLYRFGCDLATQEASISSIFGVSVPITFGILNHSENPKSFRRCAYLCWPIVPDRIRLICALFLLTEITDNYLNEPGWKCIHTWRLCIASLSLLTVWRHARHRCFSITCNDINPETDPVRDLYAKRNPNWNWLFTLQNIFIAVLLSITHVLRLYEYIVAQHPQHIPF